MDRGTGPVVPRFVDVLNNEEILSVEDYGIFYGFRVFFQRGVISSTKGNVKEALGVLKEELSNRKIIKE